MEFTDQIAARLETEGVGVVNTNIFTSSGSIIPPGDGPFLSLRETGGTGPTRVHNVAGASTQRPTAQVLVRGADPEAVKLMIRAAYDALDGIYNTTLSGTFYQSVVARQEPADIGV